MLKHKKPQFFLKNIQSVWGIKINSDWISITEPVVLIITAILAVPQIFLLRKQIKERHEEPRRENTAQFMATWCNSVKKTLVLPNKLLENLTQSNASTSMISI